MSVDYINERRHVRSYWQRRLIRWRTDPPVRTAAGVSAVCATVVVALVMMQFKGAFTPAVSVGLITNRSGLAMDRGARVTYNGVTVGRVRDVAHIDDGGVPAARLTLDIDPAYVGLIAANADVGIVSSTIFGNKYVSISAPRQPVAARLGDVGETRVTAVTTEFNTLFETTTAIAQQIDPVKLNATLTAAARAINGSGDRIGESIVDANTVLAEINSQMGALDQDIELLADLSEQYVRAAPDLLTALDNAVTTARTLTAQREDLDLTLLAAVGFGANGGDVLERGAPFVRRTLTDLIPTSETLDRNSPALFCTIRNFHDTAPKFSRFGGGANGYSLKLHDILLGAPNPYVYPDNLPRVNARGGPEGRPGCWQPITRDLFPAPYLVMDTGASIAPYNHLDVGRPSASEYIWGRQLGEHTINP
ncbi:MCE family protein [Mycobacterium kyogaense]|uniref:MCE family protein n=1 Tax=Mycobacterium kyogaense TaxID=2212479 RepID=UPI000DAED34C|nr:MCE family protein [Mycobacterium kyogaense]